MIFYLLSLIEFLSFKSCKTRFTTFLDVPKYPVMSLFFTEISSVPNERRYSKILLSSRLNLIS